MQITTVEVIDTADISDLIRLHVFARDQGGYRKENRPSLIGIPLLDSIHQPVHALAMPCRPIPIVFGRSRSCQCSGVCGW
jgi:hypothetical protein